MADKIYSQLDRKIRRPIRLLHLQAGLPDMPLLCDLENTSLEESPDYEALSYVWGAADGPKTDISIRKDRKLFQFPVLPNLRSALLQLRKTDEDRTIWIDALCINQADNAERSLQVPMMGDIYRSAQRVIIWLGEEAERSDLAMRFIQRITDLHQFDLAIKDELCTWEWYALSRLMNRSWFTRRWVVQELALARDAKVYCGADEVEWSSFADAATLFGQKIEDVAQLFKRSTEFSNDVDIFGETQALGALRLIDALNWSFRRSDDGQVLEGLVSLETLVTSLNVFETQDPRDCIYAVMDIAEDFQDMALEKLSGLHLKEPGSTLYPALQVNYALSFEEIATGFVAFCIKSSASLDIFCRPWAPTDYYYSAQNSLYSRRLPSWVCTLEDSVFEIRRDGRHVRKRGDSLVGTPGRPIYQASKGFPVIPFKFESGSHFQSMGAEEMALFPTDEMREHDLAARVQLRGIRIGTVGSLGSRAMEGIIPRDWFSMAKWNKRHGPAPEAFWRTLVADRGASGNKNPPSWYRRAFEFELSDSGKGDVAVQRIVQFGKSSMTREFFRRVQSVIWNRRFVITDMGAFGLVPAITKEGDSIMILQGLSVPVVVRRLRWSYWLVGECYIHGAMDGLKSRLQHETIDEKAMGPSLGGPGLGGLRNVVEIVNLR
jgi:hypothetical protein